MSKFLVIWSLQTQSMRPELMQSVLRMPDYARELKARKKLDVRYHIVGGHGGAWIYDVDNNEELDRLLAMSPVYNFAAYTVYPLAQMDEDAS